MSNIAVITTFPNAAWEIYARHMLQSFVQYWPKDVLLLVALDDDLLAPQVKAMLRPGDDIAVGWQDDHKSFVERNRDKDHPTDYRKQAVRFCHKVFNIKKSMDAVFAGIQDGKLSVRYLVWMDADVITNRPVTMDEIRQCLPKEGDAVAYMGRKDWDHSECGWLAFDLENGGNNLIDFTHKIYVADKVFDFEQWHDSFIWDKVFHNVGEPKHKITNLTADKPGMDIWPHSPMGKWSTHYKGPAAKTQMAQQPQPRSGSNIVIQTKNSISNEEICDNIRTNQLLIKNWIRPCEKTDEELVIVSAGPLLVAEDVREEIAAGRKVVAVKHALEPLKRAGIKPWACILLDPREHVAGFVENPNTDIIWIVASQVNPEATKRLLDAGCAVWGYHAAVNAGEEHLTNKQGYAVIIGGSATATRGLYTLGHMGFRNFRLYGYDLCYADEPDKADSKDKYGQPKYLKLSVGCTHPYYSVKRSFWTEPQFVAQFEEINDIAKTGRFKLKAFGQGMIPFFLKAKETGELREREFKTKLEPKLEPVKLSSYRELLECSKTKKTPLSMRLPKISLLNLRKLRTSSN